MNDGVNILLERMKTHPEEFYGDYNKWSEVIGRFERFLNEDDIARIYAEIGKIRCDEFTRVVMQEILREPTPVEIDPDIFTIKTTGRDPWGSATISLEEAQEQQQRTKLILEREVAKLKLGGLK